MFKRMVTMRKALHKREEDTTPRGVESDELVEELGRERSKTQRASVIDEAHTAQKVYRFIGLL